MSKVYGNQRLNATEICCRQSREIVEPCMAGGHLKTQNGEQKMANTASSGQVGTSRVFKPLSVTTLAIGRLPWTLRDFRAARRLELFDANWLLICESETFILISIPIPIKVLERKCSA